MEQYEEHDYFHKRSRLYGRNSVGPVRTPGTEEFKKYKKPIIVGAILSVFFIAGIIALAVLI